MKAVSILAIVLIFQTSGTVPSGPELESSSRKILTLNTINQNLRTLRMPTNAGPTIIEGRRKEQELKEDKPLPFEEVLWTNAGDPQGMGDPYVTFIHDVLAMVVDANNINRGIYPKDAAKRAKAFLATLENNSIGTYPHPSGIELVRRHVAKYIQKRDGGIPSRWQDIYLSNGAATSIGNVLKLLNCQKDGSKSGVMIPVPQFPFYAAKLQDNGMHAINYYLDEDNNWAININHLEQAITAAKEFCKPRAIVIINPGNPTSQVLTRKSIKDIIKFAYKHRLFIMADEAYQENINEDDCPFISFKKVLSEMGEPYNKMEMASFKTCSKGYASECGLRCGYVELINLSPDVRTAYETYVATQLTPNTVGQAALEAIVNPPREDEPSYEQWLKETTNIFSSLKKRAKFLTKKLNSIKGYSCNPIQGGMYGFPRIDIPPQAIAAAKRAGQEPDEFYSLELLNQTGIVVVPGNGFGQLPGTYHYRTTTLPQMDKLKKMVSDIKKFHKGFVAKYTQNEL
ncbi:Alanine aminotransferase 2 [Pseudolycoriella hygida]|uniref:alanine transaminase n=1 Tax=Pseudolycoriella hygida TaxID=35572 RepID=A0A9Q0MXG0_9DIPT|nr:Alanine aminotransferase 2 [Pseudolycoriella hygida]